VIPQSYAAMVAAWHWGWLAEAGLPGKVCAWLFSQDEFSLAGDLQQVLDAMVIDT